MGPIASISVFANFYRSLSRTQVEQKTVNSSEKAGPEGSNENQMFAHCSKPIMQTASLKVFCVQLMSFPSVSKTFSS